MENLKPLMKAKGMNQRELAKAVGVTESTISQLINGKRKPSFELSLKLAEVLDCESSDFVSTRTNRPGIAESFVTFPIVAEVAAGYGRTAYEGWTEGEIDVPLSWLHGRSKEDFFVLHVCGDSMYPMYQNGDIVLVLRQSTMDHSGQIGVVCYEDDNFTLKRVEYVMGEDWMKLSPVNPQYPPVMIRNERLEHCKVLGVPKYVIRKVD